MLAMRVTLELKTPPPSPSPDETPPPSPSSSPDDSLNVGANTASVTTPRPGGNIYILQTYKDNK